MPTQNIYLNEIDRFMLAADSQMKKHTGRGNVCCIAVALDAIDSAVARVERSAVFQDLSRRRLRGSSFTGYTWTATEQPAKPTKLIDLSDSAAIDEFISAITIDPRNGPPLRVYGARLRNGRPRLFFAWHHSLFDAHGAESLLFSLLSEAEIAGAAEGSPNAEKFSLARLKRANRLRKHILESARGGVRFLQKVNAPHIKYHHVEFNLEETAAIDERCRSLGVELYKSAYYLYCAAAAFRDLTNPGQDGLYIPMPRDSRRKFGKPKLVGNQLSVLFFRLALRDLESPEKALEAILASAQRNIAADFHRLSADFFKLIYFLPDALYNRLLGMPTGGRNASFYFSDTGDSLTGFHSIAQLGVKDVRHYPPNFFPPGLSFVFSRGLTLQIVLTYADGVLSPEKAAELPALLHRYLLGGSFT